MVTITTAYLMRIAAILLSLLLNSIVAADDGAGGSVTVSGGPNTKMPNTNQSTIDIHGCPVQIPPAPVQCPPAEINPVYKPSPMVPVPSFATAITTVPDECGTPGFVPGACYVHGPLLASSLLPKPTPMPSLDVGEIGCDEVVGYFLALYRYYDRKCQRIGAKCPYKYQYAAAWFDKVAADMASRCNAAC
ncbi:uncharacterized protein LOC131690266 [Topomyia yanbarensis]|uniref:uncharacterized protein LOC131690266 n=1 Tax=Topomyia yanbarensis TaxID=2498891 RepID=UPI00273BAFC5|nr:uncharacterized protein LOC131690266 [Topomyia yanbarensis]